MYQEFSFYFTIKLRQTRESFADTFTRPMVSVSLRKSSDHTQESRNSVLNHSSLLSLDSLVRTTRDTIYGLTEIEGEEMLS